MVGRSIIYLLSRVLGWASKKMYSHGWQHSLNHGVSDSPPSNSPSICGKPDVFFPAGSAREIMGMLRSMTRFRDGLSGLLCRLDPCIFHWIMICWGVGIDYGIDLCQHEGVNTMNLRVQGDMWQIVPISSAISFDLVHEPAGRAGFHAWQFWSVSTLD